MKRTFQNISPEKQQFILAAAAEVFARDGYHKANIADICLNAGISNGALYKYFANKEALFQCLLDHGIGLIQHLYQEQDTAGKPLEILESVFNSIRDMARHHRTFISIYLDLGTCAMNRFAEKVSAPLENVGKDYITNLLKRAVKNGDLPPDIHIPSAVHAIDNLIILYGYSTVSEHYKRRLLTFMDEEENVSEEKKIRFLMMNVKSILMGNP